MKARIGALLFCVWLSAAEAQGSESWRPRLKGSSQNVYFSGSGNVISQTRMKAQWSKLVPTLQPYLGIALDQDLLSNDSVVYSDNHLSFLSGAEVELPLLPVRLFGEYRRSFRLFRAVPAGTVLSEDDFRLGGYAQVWRSWLELGKSARLFGELYSDLTESSRFAWDVAFFAEAKLGARRSLGAIWAVDVFLGAAMARSRLGHLSSDFEETGPGARVSLFWKRLSASLSGKRAFRFGSASALSAENSVQFIINGEI